MRRCVDSLLVGGEDVEILIIDDGSSDRTELIRIALGYVLVKHPVVAVQDRLDMVIIDIDAHREDRVNGHTVTVNLKVVDAVIDLTDVAPAIVGVGVKVIMVLSLPV